MSNLFSIAVQASLQASTVRASDLEIELASQMPELQSLRLDLSAMQDKLEQAECAATEQELMQHDSRLQAMREHDAQLRSLLAINDAKLQVVTQQAKAAQEAAAAAHADGQTLAQTVEELRDVVTEAHSQTQAAMSHATAVAQDLAEAQAQLAQREDHLCALQQEAKALQNTADGAIAADWQDRLGGLEAALIEARADLHKAREYAGRVEEGAREAREAAATAVAQAVTARQACAELEEAREASGKDAANLHAELDRLQAGTMRELDLLREQLASQDIERGHLAEQLAQEPLRVESAVQEAVASTKAELQVVIADRDALLARVDVLDSVAQAETHPPEVEVWNEQDAASGVPDGATSTWSPASRDLHAAAQVGEFPSASQHSEENGYPEFTEEGMGAKEEQAREFEMRQESNRQHLARAMEEVEARCAEVLALKRAQDVRDEQLALLQVGLMCLHMP